MYEALTAFLSRLPNEAYGKWSEQPPEADGSPEHPYVLPHVDYEPIVYDFIHAVSDFTRQNKGALTGDSDQEEDEDEETDGPEIVYRIERAIRSDRFCEGLLLSLFRDGSIAEWLTQLKKIDDARSADPSGD